MLRAQESHLGLLGQAPIRDRILASGLAIDSRLPAREELIDHVLGGQRLRFSQPCTLTPFASAQPCSARCRFCSETLRHRHSSRLSASLRPGPRYQDQLRQALDAVRGVPLGLSLSGLEATDNWPWLAGVLDAAERHEAAGGVWIDKVLYSNANGFHPSAHGRDLASRLETFSLDRVEVSRHSPDERRNADIMRFRPETHVGANQGFAEAVTVALEHVEVRLVCVLQEGGVASVREVVEFADFARRLGVRDVVFREMSRLGDLYVRNAPWRYVESHRVPIDPLLEALWPGADGSAVAGFKPEGAVAGYYYFNVYGDLGGVRVTFETSDYSEMKARHSSDVVYKLIFHANGNLCADWDPETRVLMRCAADPS